MDGVSSATLEVVFMKINKLSKIEKVNDGYDITFHVSEEELDNLYAIADLMRDGKEYDLTIRKKTKKRSPDANAYAWKLISLIAEEVGIPPVEVYQQQILNMFTYRDVLVKDVDLTREISDWRSRGIGWLCEIVGPSNQHEGYTWLRKYKGSSAYTSTEMSKFIDILIYECKNLGIETEPPAKIRTIKNDWIGAKRKES